MNQVALVGNVTDDPELRYTQSGLAVAGFTVAVSHRSKDDGQWQDVTDGFFRCTAWRSVAENASRTLKKGMRVFVAGKLVQRTWQATRATSVSRRDPGHARGTGPPVRYRRGRQVHRRGFGFVLGQSFGCARDSDMTCPQERCFEDLIDELADNGYDAHFNGIDARMARTLLRVHELQGASSLHLHRHQERIKLSSLLELSFVRALAQV